MDLKEYLLLVAQVTPFVLPIIMALVTYWGKLGLKGNWQLLSSLLTGLVIGGATMYFVSPPEVAADWFGLVLFGLMMGLAASGVYEVVKDAASK